MYPEIYGPAWHLAEMRKKGWENGDIARVMPKQSQLSFRSGAIIQKVTKLKESAPDSQAMVLDKRLPLTLRQAMSKLL